MRHLTIILVLLLGMEKVSASGVNMPEGLVFGIINSIRNFQEDHTCESTLRILINIKSLEKIVCSTDNIELCWKAESVTALFTQLILAKLPKCIHNIRKFMLQTRKKDEFDVKPFRSIG